MPGAEALEQHDADAAPGQRPRGRRAHHAAAHDDDVGLAGGAAGALSEATSGLTSGASTASPDSPQRSRVSS